MISLLGFSLSALAPAALVALPIGLATLVYIYRARGKAPEIVVSTLFLLRQLPERLTARKSFVPPLQFWIDLAIVLLLALAAAGISAIDAAKRIAIVVDSSLSMSAKLPSGTTRFADAVRLASADASSQFGSPRFTVYSAANSLRRVSEPNISGSAAASAVSGLSPSLEPDRLESALRALVAEGTFDSVWVYTDRPLATTSAPTPVKVTTIPSDPKTASNAWISAASSTAGTISAEVRSIGESSGSVSVSGECFGADGKPAGRIPPVSVKTGAASAVNVSTVQLSPPGAAWQFCSIEAKAAGDSLSPDNEAWVTRDSQGSDVQVMSSLTLRELGLGRISGYSFMRVESADDPLFSRSTPTIAHRVRPPKLLAAPVLSVAPPPGSLPWGGSVSDKEATGLAVTRWQPSHPILQYANPTLISIPRARTITCAPGAEEVLSSSAGALICAGVRSGRRYVVSALELFPFDGAASPTVSIVTLNALKWLFRGEAGGPEAGLTPGQALLPAGSVGLRYLAPALPAPSLSAEGAASLPSPGVIVFSPPSTGRPELRSVNIHAEEESDLSRLKPIEPPQAPAAQARVGSRAPLSLAPWLAALALLVITLDVLRRMRSRNSWGAR